jgi:enediyne biosynthesis protein E4
MKIFPSRLKLFVLFAAAFAAGCNSSSQPVETARQATPAAVVAPATPEAPASPSPAATIPAELKPIEFTDVTAAAGIRFRHNNGAYGKKYLPETTGSGCAFLDYDNDGWQDVLLINAMDFSDAPKKRRAVMALYRNNQNGAFTDVTAAAGLAKPMYGMGAAVADFDNDGWQDLYVTALGVNTLFRNLGNGKFADVTAKAGVAGAPTEFSTSAAWFDYDKDGKLDLYVCNYIEWALENDLNCTLDGANKSYCTPESYKGQTSRLYRNLGAGKFADVTEKAGVLEPKSKSLGVATFDYNRDGWLDLFVANDTEPNKLYKNNGNGAFSEVATTAGVAFSEEGKARAGMGVDFADYDGSGYPSLIIGNFSNEMLGVYHNEGKSGLFIDEAPSSTIGPATLLSLTFGLFFFDYDLDGRSDIFLANGHVADDINKVQPKITYAMTPRLFRNEGKKKFTEMSRKLGKPFQRPIVARGAAHGDFDNDGDSDILVTTNGGPAYLLRNDGGNQLRSARFKLQGAASNRDGIGAKVTVFLPDGAKPWQMVHSGSSYCSQSELVLTFGLGRNDKIERVEVEWPSGKVDKLAGLPPNQFFLVKEGSGLAETKPLPMATPAPSPTPSATIAGQ